jgi:hypothetical protein
MATKRKVDPLVKKILGSPPPEPEPRSLAGEMGELMPILGQLGEMQSSQYVKDQAQLLQQQYDFFLGHADEFQNAIIGSNPYLARSQQRIEAMSGELGAMQRWMPGVGIMRQMNAMARKQLAEGGPTTPFTKELDRRALYELGLGGALTPEEERAVQQSAREAWAARGQVGGVPSAVTEVLGRESYARQRMREREGIAGMREAQNLQRQGMGQQLGQSQQQLSLAHRQAQQSFALGRAQYELGAGDFNRATTYAPMLLGATQNVQTPSTGQIMGAGLGYGQDLFSTNLNMAADIFNSYQNNAAALMGAQMQSQMVGAAGAAAGRGAMAGGLMGAGGAIGGALISAAPGLIAL